jgi:cytochrome oxidase Cu insertion factor (SCO1/SenC/PrrC family)
MRELDRKDYILISSAAVLVLVVGFGILQDGEERKSVKAGNWQEIELDDVNSEETFSVAELEKPVLVETFAVWCPTCTRQQQEIKELHQDSKVTSVSLNVDPNEDEQQIRRHTHENGFDWRYAISPTELTRALVQEYGASMANPPSAPAVLVCKNGTRKLQNGVKPVSKLKEEVEKGC